MATTTAARPRWLLITSHGNWDRFAAEGVWAFDMPTRLNRVEPGDHAIVYLTSDGGVSSIGGQVTFRTSILPEPIRRGGPFTMHPFHAEVDVDAYLLSPLVFEPIRPTLAFLPDTQYWGLWVRGKPIREIPPEDYERLHLLISNTVKARGATQPPPRR